MSIFKHESLHAHRQLCIIPSRLECVHFFAKSTKLIVVAVIFIISYKVCSLFAIEGSFCNFLVQLV
jgi:hypothetical protein